MSRLIEIKINPIVDPSIISILTDGEGNPITDEDQAIIYSQITLGVPLLDVVSIADAKNYCRVDFNDDDLLFARLIEASRQRLEKYTGRVFLRSNCSAIYAQESGGDRVRLFFSDNIDLDASSDYYLSLIGESYIDSTDELIKLNYIAGYDIIPEWIKQAVLMDVSWMYENRGDVTVSAGQINNGTKAFLGQFAKFSMI